MSAIWSALGSSVAFAFNLFHVFFDDFGFTDIFIGIFTVYVVFKFLLLPLIGGAVGVGGSDMVTSSLSAGRSSDNAVKRSAERNRPRLHVHHIFLHK